MDIFWQIGSQAVPFLILVFGLSGVTFSLLLLVWPAAVVKHSTILNREISIENKLRRVDDEIHISGFFFKHSFYFGICLICAAFFLLFGDLANSDSVDIARIFFKTTQSQMPLIFSAISLIGKIVCWLGLVLGIMLVFAPKKLLNIENRLNTRIETQPLFDKLDTTRHPLDLFLSRHPLVSGLAGVTTSAYLVISSIYLLGRW